MKGRVKVERKAALPPDLRKASEGVEKSEFVMLSGYGPVAPGRRHRGVLEIEGSYWFKIGGKVAWAVATWCALSKLICVAR